MVNINMDDLDRRSVTEDERDAEHGKSAARRSIEEKIRAIYEEPAYMHGIQLREKDIEELADQYENGEDVDLDDMSSGEPSVQDGMVNTREYGREAFLRLNDTQKRFLLSNLHMNGTMPVSDIIYTYAENSASAPEIRRELSQDDVYETLTAKEFYNRNIFSLTQEQFDYAVGELKKGKAIEELFISGDHVHEVVEEALDAAGFMDGVAGSQRLHDIIAASAICGKDYMGILNGNPEKEAALEKQGLVSVSEIGKSSYSALDSRVKDFLKSVCYLDADVSVENCIQKFMDSYHRNDSEALGAYAFSDYEKFADSLCIAMMYHTEFDGLSTETYEARAAEFDERFQKDPLFHKMAEFFQEGIQGDLEYAEKNLFVRMYDSSDVLQRIQKYVSENNIDAEKATAAELTDRIYQEDLREIFDYAMKQTANFYGAIMCRALKNRGIDVISVKVLADMCSELEKGFSVMQVLKDHDM